MFWLEELKSPGTETSRLAGSDGHPLAWLIFKMQEKTSLQYQAGTGLQVTSLFLARSAEGSRFPAIVLPRSGPAKPASYYQADF